MRQDREYSGEWQRQGYMVVCFPHRKRAILSAFIDWLWRHTSYKKRLDEEKEESCHLDS